MYLLGAGIVDTGLPVAMDGIMSPGGGMTAGTPLDVWGDPLPSCGIIKPGCPITDAVVDSVAELVANLGAAILGGDMPDEVCGNIT